MNWDCQSDNKFKQDFSKSSYKQIESRTTQWSKIHLNERLSGVSTGWYNLVTMLFRGPKKLIFKVFRTSGLRKDRRRKSISIVKVS